MNQKQYLIRGTLMLTIMGFLTRMAGFAYKIFLSRTIGASEIGLYQIAVPVLSFCTALCSGGMQTAVSRSVARYRAEGEYRRARWILLTGLFLSVSLSLFCAVILYLQADFISRRILLEQSCAPILSIMAFSLPFSMIHGIFCGYFMGTKQILPPALSQFTEQFIRIWMVVTVCTVSLRRGTQPDARFMAFGGLAGEAASAVYCVSSVLFLSGRNKNKSSKTESPRRCRKLRNISPRGSIDIRRNFQKLSACLLAAAREILKTSVPLSLNRLLLCILQMAEAALLPQMLQRSGLTSGEALSVYGTLTGMALPMILFPTAVTSALGMLLLPAISEAQALRQQRELARTADTTFLCSLLLGSFCLGAFLLFGENGGNLLFHSELAGCYIRQLALICPLMYIGSSMISILHGLGKSTLLLFWNLAGAGLRLSAILFLVPIYGINGYLCGMLFDHLFLTLNILISLRRCQVLTVSVSESLTRLLLPAILSGGTAYLFLVFPGQRLPDFLRLAAGILLYSGGFLACARFSIKALFTGTSL